MPTLDECHYSLSLNKCPHGVLMIALDYRDSKGNGHGTRLTSLKCCGSWETLQSWNQSLSELRAHAELFAAAAEEVSDGSR